MTTLFIGLGKMGGPMVRRYAPTRKTILYDVDQAAATALAESVGASVVPSLDVITNVDVVILMLPNSRIVETVLTGENRLLERLPKGALVIDMGSSEPASTKVLARQAAHLGISYVDAPVSGGVAKAKTGKLSIMVGGTIEDSERALEHLAPLGTQIFTVGPAGSGHAAKALNNLLSATNLSAAAEVLTIAKNFGIEADVMVEVINASTGRSQATEVKYPKHVLTGTFDSGFAMDLMLKDLAIAHELSSSAGLTTPITNQTVTTLTEAHQILNRDDLDHTEIARFYEQANHVELRHTK